jgi:hypothetical protein
MIMERAVRNGFTREQVYRDLMNEFKEASQHVLRLTNRFRYHPTEELQRGTIVDINK